MTALKPQDKKFLLELARKSLEVYLDTGKKPHITDIPSDRFREKRGVFTTLRKDGELFGCMGQPIPTKTLKDAVIDTAVNAGFNDPRFPELEKSDMDSITIEISVLTVPEEIEAESPEKISESVKVGEDGLIVSSGFKSGLLLPQVAVENDWEAEEFLEQTCRKAGLQKSAWKERNLKIQKFQAEVFSEESELED